MRHETNVTINI